MPRRAVRRLVIMHAVTGAAGAAFAVSLAGSLFFNVSVNAARPRILLYLLSTLAPFALVVPLLAPLTDRFRGGYRAIIVATAIGRSAVCALLANHLTTLFFFPEAFAVLVLGKTYTIAKSALVPRLVADQEKLVAANAQMERVATVGGLLGGFVAALVLRLAGPPAVVIMASVGQAGAAALAIRIPRPAPAPPNRVVEVVELTSAPLSLAASAMIVLRFAVGFITFLLALNLKTASEPAWVYGMVLVAGVVGGLSGTVIGPLLRRRVAEEALLTAALAVSGALCILGRGARPPDQRGPDLIRRRRGRGRRPPSVRQHHPTARPRQRRWGGRSPGSRRGSSSPGWPGRLGRYWRGRRDSWDFSSSV